MYFSHSFICWTQQNNRPRCCLTFCLLFRVRKFAEVMLKLEVSWEGNRNGLQQEHSAAALKIQLCVHLEPPWPLAGRIPHFQLCALLLAPLSPQSCVEFSAFKDTTQALYLVLCTELLSWWLSSHLICSEQLVYQKKQSTEDLFVNDIVSLLGFCCCFVLSFFLIGSKGTETKLFLVCRECLG